MNSICSLKESSSLNTGDRNYLTGDCKYLARVVSLIFLPKTLIWNKIMFPAATN